MDDWRSACRNVMVAEAERFWCLKDDMKLLGLQPEWAIFRICGGTSNMGQTSNPRVAWNRWTFQK